MTQLSTLQNYLRSSFKQGESTKEQYKKLGPQNAGATRVYTLPKIHKTFTMLPKYRSIVDTRSTCYYNFSLLFN